MTPPTVSALPVSLAASTPASAGDSGLASALAGAGSPAAGTGGMSAFLGFTALVLTGFLVLARLSQRVVDDAEETAGGERVRVPAGPTTGEPATDEDTNDHVRTGPATPEEHAATAADTDPTPPDADVTPADPGATPANPDPPGVARDEADGGASPSAVEGGSNPAAGDARFDGSARVVPSDATRRATREADAPASVSPAALLANVALTQGLFGGVLAAGAWFFQVPGTALGLAGGRVTGLAAVGAGVAFGVALWVGNELAGALADATGAGYDEGLRQMLAPADPRGWGILLGGVLPVIALVEEFLFRAAAVGAASAWLGGTPAAAWTLAVVSSLAFALGHGAQGRVGVVVTGTLGFALAAGFLLSGSFVVVVVAHYVVNATEFLVHEGAGLPDPVWS